MKKQTFIALIKDENGNNIGFERFACKKLETVRKNMIDLFNNDLYRICMSNANMIYVYATPDGYNKDIFPAAQWEVELNG